MSRRDKMRRFAEISHTELLVSVERNGNVSNVFILIIIQGLI